MGTLPGILEFNEENQAISVYPNPYKGSTTISYVLTKEAIVNLEVYDALGELIVTLVEEAQLRGEHSYAFSAKELGEAMGVYIVLVNVSGRTYSKRIVEIR